MNRQIGISWRRIAAEALAIVLSILVAFAIDAWWDERKERAAEAELLSRLQIEFETNLSRIGERGYYRAVLENGEALFAQLEQADAAGETSVMVSGSTIRLLAFAPTFEADTPVLDGLIRAGRLEIIENREIQTVLATWERLLRDYTSFAERARRNVDARLLPALYERGDLGATLMAQLGMEDFRGEGADGSVEIRIDDELKGIVAGRHLDGRAAQNKFEQLGEAALAVIEAIDAQR